MEENQVDARIEKLEYRLDQSDERMNKMDKRNERIWDRLDSNSGMQIQTRTLVEEVQKDISEINVQLTRLVDAQQSFITAVNKELANIRTNSVNRWEQFFSKAFWLIVGIIAALAITKL